LLQVVAVELELVLVAVVELVEFYKIILYLYVVLQVIQLQLVPVELVV
jgi:hypothetical protein